MDSIWATDFVRPPGQLRFSSQSCCNGVNVGSVVRYGGLAVDEVKYYEDNGCKNGIYYAVEPSELSSVCAARKCGSWRFSAPFRPDQHLADALVLLLAAGEVAGDVWIVDALMTEAPQ